MSALPQAASDEAAAASARSLAAAGELLRVAGLPELHRRRLEDLAAEVTRNWAGPDGAPAIVVLDSLQDPRAPQEARDIDRRQRAAGARTRPKAFAYADTIYLLANALTTRKEGLTSLVHEAVGHWGLRRTYGDRLDELLDQVASTNRLAVWEKARAYGLDLKDPAQRREAAEEVLAEVAQENRDPALVERLEAAVRGLLRKLVPSMRKAAFSRAELLANFIAPVRARMQRADGVTRLQSFKRWFGASKIAADDGKPLRVFHGTTHDFTAFDPKAPRTAIPLTGLFFTPEPIVAENYASIGREIRDDEGFIIGAEGGNVMPVYLAITNPVRLRYDDWGRGSLTDWKTVEADLQKAIAAGHDGAVIEGWRDGSGPIQYVAFRPEQIKSAIGNRGTFDPSSPDLRFDRDHERAAGQGDGADAFRHWFSGSKVVDGAGRPLVVYHGTKSDFERFDIKAFGASDEGLAGKGFYFTYNPEEASGYALNEQFGKGDAPNVRPAYVSLRNPLVITHGVLPDGRKLQDLHNGTGINTKGGAALRKLAEDAGHDGVMWVSRDGAVRHVVAWKPEQIKSAIAERDLSRPSPAELRFDRGSAMPMSAEDSEAFRRWFATSKVVDDEGRPLVVYHGTGVDLSEFKLNDVKHAQAYGRGIYFTSSPDYADSFAYGEQPNIVPAYVALQNPLVVEIRTAEFKAAFPPDGTPESITAAAKAKGHDGIIIRSPQRGGGHSLEVVAFEPSQVKSAIGNRGMYDPSSPDLRFHRAEAELAPSTHQRGAGFDQWFANSKVVGRDGKPLVVYHGTAGDFEDFDIPSDTLGAWFIDDTGEASGYAAMAARRNGGEGANVRPVYLSIQNPAPSREFSLAMNEAGRTSARHERIAVLRGLLEAKGYDGIDMGGGVWRAFRADQVRNAIAAEVASDIDRARPAAAAKPGATSTAFRRWFGDSKVVRDDGTPLVVYHGTASDIAAFDSSRSGRNYPGSGGNKGFFFTSLPATAEVYAEQAAEPFRTRDGAPNIMPVYLSLRQPYVRQAQGSPDKWFDHNRRALYEAAEKRGADGILVKGGKGFEARSVYVAFKPEQIKSAIGNGGTYNPARWDIRFDRGDLDHDLFGGYADASTTIERQELVSSKGDTAPVSKGNLDSAGRIVSSTEQALERFWDWYSDSEMVTPDGMPLLLYHATSGDFTAFETMRATKNTGLFGCPYDARRAGIFLTSELDFAESYLEDRAGGHVMPVYANLTRVADLRRGASAKLESELEAAGYNVRMLNHAQHHWELFDEEYGGPDFVAALKAAGYDGAAFLEADGEGQARTTYVAFDPEQVKSALGNRGTWSASSADVRFQRDEVLRGQAGGDYSDKTLLQIWADLAPAERELLVARPGEEAAGRDRPRPI